MTTAVLIFTFSPVQSFIAEARRAGDLYTGSKILSELARAAASAIQDRQGQVVYPASLAGDVPNVIVARAPAEQAAQIAGDAHNALREAWRGIATTAYSQFNRWGFADSAFDAIWERQIEHIWNVFWVTAEEQSGYGEAYERARDALDAVKRSRLFDACDEPGIKDTLSGQREALHPADQTSYRAVKRFWKTVAGHQQIGPSKLRPEGRERLDAIGAVKRFCSIARGQQFPSTSTIAALDFIERAKGKALAALKDYREVVATLGVYQVGNDPHWPFDGDLLHEETLTRERLKDSYDLQEINAQKLNDARQALRALHKAAGGAPSPYYALLILDGDNMGSRIGACLKQDEPVEAHRQLSQSLSNFSAAVAGIVPAECLIYNGGDDVMAFLPLGWALDIAQKLAAAFEETARTSAMPGTASVGMALAHHLHPLDAVLRAARAAEREAKRVEGKAALCITALKRSGEEETAATKWDGTGTLKALIQHLQQGNLSGRFVSDTAFNLRAIPDGQSQMLETELFRQARRHAGEAWRNTGGPAQLAGQLSQWVNHLPGGVESLRRWLGIARFITRESEE